MLRIDGSNIGWVYRKTHDIARKPDINSLVNRAISNKLTQDQLNHLVYRLQEKIADFTSNERTLLRSSLFAAVLDEENIFYSEEMREIARYGVSFLDKADKATSPAPLPVPIIAPPMERPSIASAPSQPAPVKPVKIELPAQPAQTTRPILPQPEVQVAAPKPQTPAPAIRPLDQKPAPNSAPKTEVPAKPVRPAQPIQPEQTARPIVPHPVIQAAAPKVAQLQAIRPASTPTPPTIQLDSMFYRTHVMPSLEKKARNSEELRQWQEVARGFVGAIKGHFSPYGPNYGEYREFKWGFWHEAIERVRSSQELADLIKGWINERKAKNPTAWAGFNEPKIS